MKAANKLIKKEQPKGDNANTKEITHSDASSGLTTPEIIARSRKMRTCAGYCQGSTAVPLAVPHKS